MDLFPTSSWDVDYACENLNKQLFGSPSDKKIRKSMVQLYKNDQNKSMPNKSPALIDSIRNDLLVELKGRFANKRKLDDTANDTSSSLPVPKEKKVKKKVQFKPKEENSLHIYTPRPKTLKKIKITKGKCTLDLQAAEESTKKHKKFSLLLLKNVKKHREPTSADCARGVATTTSSNLKIKSKKAKDKKAKTIQNEILASKSKELNGKKQKLKNSKKKKEISDESISHNIIEKPGITRNNKNCVDLPKLTPVVQNEIEPQIKSTSFSETQNKSLKQNKMADFSQQHAEIPSISADTIAPRRRQPGSLRERMLRKLQASRFRYLNEQMYCSRGNEALDYFKKDPSAFQAYHKGYRQQVAQWPLNPVDKIIKMLQKKSPNLIIADFGCGDAKLARSLPNTVHSFDLVAISDHVIACDMAHTPLDNESVDVAVFCLSLMGTNITDYLVEANRVLKTGGILKIAEVESRFENVDAFIKSLLGYGFTIKNKDFTNNLFYFMDLQKVSGTKKQSKSALSDIALKPCLYKKR